VYIKDLEAQASLTRGRRDWPSLLVRLLKRSFGMSLRNPGEIAELALSENVFNVVLECFGFTFCVVSTSECDVLVCEQTTPFLFLEGKESSHLPRRPTNRPQLWSELCLFGFAIQIARTESEHKVERQTLATRLGLDFRNEKLASTDYTPSPTVNALLLQSEECIGPLVDEIRRQRMAGHIEDTDAVNLWAAVMQACYYSVAKHQNLSIVVSARMFWFIRLATTQDEHPVLHYQCRVDISDAHPVGSRFFMRTFVSFLKYAANDKSPLNGTGLRAWETALSWGKGNGGGKGKSSTKGKEAEPATKKPKTGDQHEPMGTDEYGVIPWFDQIDEKKLATAW
jgi:hypothetical protein